MRERFPRHPRKDNPTFRIFDRSFSDYMFDFGKVDVDCKIPDVLWQLVKKKDAVVIDLMAGTQALRSLYKFGISGKFLAVGVHDKRSKEMVNWDQEHGIF